MSASPNDFREKTIAGVSWSVFSQLTRQVIQFSIGIVLARLLSPDEYGLIGMILVFSGFAAVFLDFGFGAALIQKQNTTQHHYSSVFWVNLSIGAILTLCFIAGSPMIAWFFNEPALVPLTIFLSFNFIFGSLVIVQTALLRKELLFKQLAIIDITTLIISGGVGISLAWTGYGVWSLAWQSLLFSIARMCLVWSFSNWRPIMLFKRDAIKELFGFSANLLGFSVLNYWLRNADNLLVGRVLGTAALGIYNKSYGIMLLPTQMISQTIGQVMFPAFSSIQEDKKRIATIYLRITGVIALITFPMMVLLWLVAEDFILVVFGNQWEAMIPVLKVFCFIGMLQSIGTLNGNLYLSQGRSDLQFKVGIAVSALGICAIVLGLPWGVEGVAYAYGIFTALIIYPSIKIAVSLVGLDFLEIVKHLRWVSISTVIMACVVWLTSTLLPPNMSRWVYLGLQIVTGIITYGLLIHFLRLSPYLDMKQIIYEKTYFFRKVEQTG